jgi:hypothetical protein
MSSPLRTIVLPIVVAAVGLGALWGGIMLATASPGGCATALLEGTLEEDSSTGSLVVRTDDGHAISVTWPIGYGVLGGANGETVLTRLFVQVARPGDRVSLGGGEGSSADFAACGVIRVTPGPASPEPRQPDLDPVPGPQG